MSEQGQRFDLGRVFEDPAAVLASSAHPWLDEQDLAHRDIGLWECDLSDNTLTWSTRVYDIFGLPRGASVCREEAAAFYAEGSRAIMERLRAYAIKHRRGFTLDAEIRPALGSARSMRLVAAPVCDGDRVVRLRGIKRIIRS